MINRVKSFLYWLTLLLLISIAALTALSTLDIPGFNFDFLIVQSGSMEPTIKTGSVILVVPQDSYQPQDIITFKNGDVANIRKPGNATTHRIIDTGLYQQKLSFTTKGDANPAADREQVPISWVIGKVILVLPYLGYLVSFTQTQMGIILLIVIPATIIVYQESLTLKKEITRILAQRKNQIPISSNNTKSTSKPKKTKSKSPAPKDEKTKPKKSNKRKKTKNKIKNKNS